MYNSCIHKQFVQVLCAMYDVVCFLQAYTFFGNSYSVQTQLMSY